MKFITKVWNFFIELGEAIHEYKKGTKQYPKGWYYQISLTKPFSSVVMVYYELFLELERLHREIEKRRKRKIFFLTAAFLLCIICVVYFFME